MKCLGCQEDITEGIAINVVTESVGRRFRRWYSGGTICEACMVRVEQRETRLWVTLVKR